MTDWSTFIDGYHRTHPGITEAILGASHDSEGRTPYDWVADACPHGRVLDVGCGSGPMQPHCERWLGIDRSGAELRFAARRGRVPLLDANSDALPLRADAVEAALSVMSLMVVANPVGTVAEIRRALGSGGTVVVVLPAHRPLSVLDAIRFSMVLLALRRATFPFPNPAVVRDPIRLLHAAGVRVDSDERRRFRYPITGPDAAARFVESLYLPGVGASRRASAARLVERWREIGVPLRRIVGTITNAPSGSRPVSTVPP